MLFRSAHRIARVAAAAQGVAAQVPLHRLQVAPDVAGPASAGGRGSSHVWGNLQTVEWNLRDNTLRGGSDPRNPVGKAQVQATGAGAP